MDGLLKFKKYMGAQHNFQCQALIEAYHRKCFQRMNSDLSSTSNSMKLGEGVNNMDMINSDVKVGGISGVVQSYYFFLGGGGRMKVIQ